MKKYNLSLFIFRRDFRIFDNTALIEALRNSKRVVCIFVFNKLQYGDFNEFRSLNAMQFLKNSLLELDKVLKSFNSKLFFLNSDLEFVLDDLFFKFGFKSIYLNSDYTPFSIKRDKQILDFCLKNNIDFNCFDDALLFCPKNSLKDDKKPYLVFTSFYRKNLYKKISLPVSCDYDNFFLVEDLKKFGLKLSDFCKRFPCEFDFENVSIKLKGGRVEGLSLLDNLKNLEDYSKLRDFPSVVGTSFLSSHLRFGTLSIREVFYFAKSIFGLESDFIKQLFWRDFFYCIGYFFPRVLGSNFNLRYDKIKWNFNLDFFKLWKEGKTGFPIVDAGMRELNKTGFMHSRVRMICASFLVKDLHISWQEGEKYFATKLIDYDPLINNGSWQWVASTGCDSVPYFRIFNPKRQQIRFDKNCFYIKKWVEELKDVSEFEIHNFESCDLRKYGYVKPIVEHKEQSNIIKSIYKSCF